ncbi:hypothetical protein BS78_02G029400 [Paspalum vaginatum]|nr:hypothetical protein BS78_02G029400 [Paspalum vaginatum]
MRQWLRLCRGTTACPATATTCPAAATSSTARPCSCRGSVAVLDRSAPPVRVTGRRPPGLRSVAKQGRRRLARPARHWSRATTPPACRAMSAAAQRLLRAPPTRLVTHSRRPTRSIGVRIGRHSPSASTPTRVDHSSTYHRCLRHAAAPMCLSVIQFYRRVALHTTWSRSMKSIFISAWNPALVVQVPNGLCLISMLNFQHMGSNYLRAVVDLYILHSL